MVKVLKLFMFFSASLFGLFDNVGQLVVVFCLNKQLVTWVTVRFGEGNGKPFQYPCLANPMDRGARRAPVRGVTESGRSDFTHSLKIW